MTPELAAEKAADMLDLATDDVLHGDIVENRIAIADAWMRLHTALANAPKSIGPVTVNIEGLAVKDVDPKKIAAECAAMGFAPKAQPEIGVYSERAHLIAYLATQHRAIITYNDPAEPDWPVIYIDTQLGQLSWHLAADDLPLFPHVPVVEPHAVEWDGHDTPEKYRRLDALVRLVAENRGLI